MHVLGRSLTDIYLFYVEHNVETILRLTTGKIMKGIQNDIYWRRLALPSLRNMGIRIDDL